MSLLKIFKKEPEKNVEDINKKTYQKPERSYNPVQEYEVKDNVETEKKEPQEVYKTDIKQEKNTDEQIEVKPVVKEKVFYKRPVDKKISILLIENTEEVLRTKKMLVKLIENLLSSGLVCIINYGTEVRKSDIFEKSNFDEKTLFYENDKSGNILFYDALQELKSMLTGKINVPEKQYERINVKDIEVIGIGTCKDNGSKFPKEVGIHCFNSILKKNDVTTKYLCLTEESFISAAEIGFRSIVSISRNY